MKRSTTLIVLAVIVILGSVVTLQLAHRAHPANAETPPPENVSTRVESPTPIIATPARHQTRHSQRDDRAKAIVDAVEKSNVAIGFWGKVVDHKQRPIDGVVVRFSYSTEHASFTGTTWGKQKIHRGEVATDASGMFVVSGIKGHTLTIESLTKRGYGYTSKGAKIYNYYGDTASGKFAPEPTKPVMFVMLSNSLVEPLVSYGGDFGRTIRLPGNGTPVRWSVWKGQSDQNGELKITFEREPAVLARVGESATWSAKVEIVDGGIVEASRDESFYEAPSEGYISELDYPKVEQKRGVPARTFYIKTAEGKYGRIELELYADDEGPTARCLIRTTMNPSGSRILESALASPGASVAK